MGQAVAEGAMVVTIGMLGVFTGILAAALAHLSGLSILGVILAYCLTGSVAGVLVVMAIALSPRPRADQTVAEARTV